MISYHTINVNNQEIFYREAGNKDKPVFLLLHGFPTSSHMFRNLMPLLENDFYLIAPDYIGFGQSASPSNKVFDYTFDNLAEYIKQFLSVLHINQYYMYVFDYGAPIGFRLALDLPNSILGIVSQNGNIYEEGLGKKWGKRKDYWLRPTAEKREFFKSAFAPETIIKQYHTGQESNYISPDGYSLDIYYTLSKGYADRQSDLIFDYQNNLKLYPKFQAYLKIYQPKLLAVWGKNDPSFIYPGAKAFLKDDPNSEVHLLNAGHFALETQYNKIAELILRIFQGQLLAC